LLHFTLQHRKPLKNMGFAALCSALSTDFAQSTLQQQNQ
jgi:hypothetical protein